MGKCYSHSGSRYFPRHSNNLIFIFPTRNGRITIERKTNALTNLKDVMVVGYKFDAKIK